MPNFISAKLVVGWDDASKLRELASLAQTHPVLEPNLERIMKPSRPCSREILLGHCVPQQLVHHVPFKLMKP